VKTWTSLIALLNDERGHAQTLPGMLIAVAGAVLLGIGAAADDASWLAVTGGIVLALGLIAMQVSHHVAVDYGIYDRLETLEKK
jgi:hypothetical protein